MTSGRYRLSKATKSVEENKSDWEVETPAELGIPFKGTKEQVEVPGRNGYVFARIRGDLSETVQAFNDKVSLVYGLPVILIRDKVDKGKWRVKGRDIGRYGEWQSSDLPFHGATHSFNPEAPGADPVWVYNRQFMPWAVIPSGTSGGPNVIVEEGISYSNGEFTYNGITGTQDIVPTYLPTGSNKARMVLVYSELGGNPLLVGGNEFDASLTGTGQIIPFVPAVPISNAQPQAAIRIVSGTTKISWDNIYDVRSFSGNNGFTPTGTVGHVIQDEGTPLPNRSALDFIGAGLVAYDDAAGNRTIVSGAFKATMALDDLTDVNAPTPNTGDVLKWAGGDWVNGPAGSSPISWQRTLVVDQGGNGQFTNIADACDYGQSVSPKDANNPWIIYIMPGIYYENQQVNIPSFMNLVGAFPPGYLYESPVRLHLQVTTGTALTLNDQSGLVNLDVVYEESLTGNLNIIGFAPTGFINSAFIVDCSFDFDVAAGGYKFRGFCLDRGAVDLYMRNVLFQWNIDSFDPYQAGIQLLNDATRLFVFNSRLFAISVDDQEIITAGATGTTANVYAYNSYIEGRLYGYNSSLFHFQNVGFTDAQMPEVIVFGGNNNATFLEGKWVSDAVPGHLDVLTFSQITNRWYPNPLPSIPSTLNDLSDVVISSAVSGQYLRWNGLDWVNVTGSSAVAYLDDLLDVSLSVSVSGQFLRYNGTNWINSLPSPSYFEREYRVPAITVKTGASAPNITTRNVGATGTVQKPVVQFSKTVQNDVYFPIHAPVDMDFSIPAHFHLMWEAGAGWTAGNYLWKLEYLIIEGDGSTLLSGTPTTLSANVTPPNATTNIETQFSGDIFLSFDQEMICHFYRDVAGDNGDDVGSVEFFELNYTSVLSGTSSGGGGGGGSGSSSLSGLSDVSINSLTSGNAFAYNGTSWVNVTGSHQLYPPTWKLDLDTPKTFFDTPDDEFLSTSLDAKWTVLSGTVGSVNLFSTGTNLRVYDLTTRPSWLGIQISSLGFFEMRQDYALPDGKSIILCISPSPLSDASVANNELWTGFCLNDNDTNFSAGNYTQLFTIFDSSVMQVQLLADGASIGTSYNTGTLPAGSRMYLRISRNNLDYHGFFSKDGTNWTPLGKKTAAGAYNNIWIVCQSRAAFATPNPITLIDWIRLGSNNLDPW